MTEADLYTVEALRPKRGRAWLAVCVVAVCVLLAWVAWLVAQYVQAREFYVHERVVMKHCYDEAGGTFSEGKCSAPQVTFEVIPFSPGHVPIQPAPGPGEPVFPILPHKEQETEL